MAGMALMELPVVGAVVVVVAQEDNVAEPMTLVEVAVVVAVAATVELVDLVVQEEVDHSPFLHGITELEEALPTAH